jgi:hypothetical protein
LDLLPVDPFQAMLKLDVRKGSRDRAERTAQRREEWKRKGTEKTQLKPDSAKASRPKRVKTKPNE